MQRTTVRACTAAHPPRSVCCVSTRPASGLRRARDVGLSRALAPAAVSRANKYYPGGASGARESGRCRLPRGFATAAESLKSDEWCHSQAHRLRDDQGSSTELLVVEF